LAQVVVSADGERLKRDMEVLASFNQVSRKDSGWGMFIFRMFPSKDHLVMVCPSEIDPVPLALKVMLEAAFPLVECQVPTKGLVAGAGVLSLELLPLLLPPLLQPIIPIIKIKKRHRTKFFRWCINFPFFLFYKLGFF
jgi:hypothetical protein